MSRVIVALTETGYSPIADSLYEYIQLEGSLPEEDKVIALFKDNAANLSEYGHKLNRLFIECVQYILLCGVPNYEQVKKLLRIDESFCEENSSEDSFKISFAGITYQDPSTEELETINEIIRNYDLDYIQNIVEVANTFTLTVPIEAMNRIKEIDVDGICEPLVECGEEVTTHIIEIGYLRERAEQNGKSTNVYHYYEAIWDILSQYLPDIILLKEAKPDFLAVYAVN